MGHKDVAMLKVALLKANLTDTEFIVLAKRYGLDDKPPFSILELAKILNQKEDEIRKIHRVAFFKLRDSIDEKEKCYFDRLIFALFKPRKA